MASQAVRESTLKLEIGMLGETKHEGFTLIELLIVILIIGITIGFAVISFGDFGEKRHVLAVAQEFKNMVSLAREEAILEATTLGIRISKSGYQVLRFEAPSTWIPMKQPLFLHDQLPRKIELRLRGQHQPNNLPQIMMDASGDMTPFAIDFGTAHQPNLFVIRGKNNGLMVISP